MARTTRSLVDVLEAMLVAPEREWWGFDLARSTGIPTATVYGVLARLEDQAVVIGRFEAADPEDLKRPRRRLYRITPDGVTTAKSTVAAWRARRRSIWAIPAPV